MERGAHTVQEEVIFGRSSLPPPLPQLIRIRIPFWKLFACSCSCIHRVGVAEMPIDITNREASWILSGGNTRSAIVRD